MRLRYSRRALAQIDEVINYIANDDPRAAAAFGTRVEQIAELLRHYPSMGRRTDLGDVRTVSLRPFPYRLFCQVFEDAKSVCFGSGILGAPAGRSGKTRTIFTIA